MIRRATVLLGLLLVARPAMPAAEPEIVAPAEPSWWLAVQTYSFHEHTAEVDLHNTTPGIGVLRRQEYWLVGAGIFRNSLGRWAGYGYGGYQVPLRWIRLGAIAGATHHYNANNGGIVPLAGAVATVPLGDRFELEFIGIPRIRDYTYATVNVSISWRFK